MATSFWTFVTENLPIRAQCAKWTCYGEGEFYFYLYRDGGCAVRLVSFGWEAA